MFSSGITIVMPLACHIYDKAYQNPVFGNAPFAFPSTTVTYISSAVTLALPLSP
jgi:hypothetical protein